MPLPASIVGRLREHLRVRDLSDDRVLVISLGQLDHTSRLARTASGVVGRVRFHDLRHTALTRFGAAGATIAEMKAISGHKTAQMVLRYMHADEAPASLVERAAIEIKR